MFRLILAATWASALCTSALADITHWVSEPYQPAVAPGDDLLHPYFNDGSYWTVDLMVTISGDDDWTSTAVEAIIDSGLFFYHAVGDRTPAWAPYVEVLPALEYDTMFLSTEADANNQPAQADPNFVFKDCGAEFIDAVWYDGAPNAGDGDFVVARFTIGITHLPGALLTLEGDSTTFEHGGLLFPFEFEVWIEGSPSDCNNNGIWDYLDMMDCDGSAWCSDCNNNGIIDECDIADQTSDDYDLNGVPDECDPDCNGNGIPDACDVACDTGNCASHPLGCGGSEDVNRNGVPDECECVGDITGNGATDQADLGILLALWGYCEGHPNYNPNADLNADGCISHADLGILLTDWECGN